jgi:hypothetical protein
LGSGLIIGVVFVVPVIIWRLIRRKPLLPYRGEKIESSIPLFLELFICGGFCLVSLFMNKPYSGLVFFLFFLAFGLALFYYKKGKL